VVGSFKGARIRQATLAEKREAWLARRFTAAQVAVEPSRSAIITWLLWAEETWDPVLKPGIVRLGKAKVCGRLWDIKVSEETMA